jgi:hypothetical protein
LALNLAEQLHGLELPLEFSSDIQRMKRFTTISFRNLTIGFNEGFFYDVGMVVRRMWRIEDWRRS